MASELNDSVDRWQHGDPAAYNDMMPLVYDELRRIARRFLKDRRPGQTLQPTALVNEAYLKLFDRAELRVNDRAHFLAVMARVMRQVLIDYARAARASKRGGDLERVEWDTAVQFEEEPRSPQVLEINRALELLGAENAALADIVEMHYFGGMTAEEIAVVKTRSPHAIRHDLRVARAWLRREIAAGA